MSGELYKFDGESIELMPINTDTLLKSHWDNIDISGWIPSLFLFIFIVSIAFYSALLVLGGKEISTYAIHVETGQIVYECSMYKCSNGSEDEHLNIDTLLLRRETQKVRAIEMSSRTER